MHDFRYSDSVLINLMVLVYQGQLGPALQSENLNQVPELLLSRTVVLFGITRPACPLQRPCSGLSAW